MRVLLTGASGFVGSHIMERLVRDGHVLTLLVRSPWVGDVPPGGRLERGSLEDPATLAAACKNVDVVVHCAGLTKAVRATDFDRVNGVGTARLLRAAKQENSIKRFLLISSLAAAGPATPDRPAVETAVPNPVSAYGRSKRTGELRVMEQDRLPWIILRPPLVYGPRDKELLPLLRWAERRRLPIPHTGRQPLSVLYVEDLAAAVSQCLLRDECCNRVYHVADPVWTTPEGLVEAIAGPARSRFLVSRRVLRGLCLAGHAGSRLSGRPSMFSLWKWPEWSAPGWVCDSRRLARDIGFVAQTDLAEGIRRTQEAVVGRLVRNTG